MTTAVHAEQLLAAATEVARGMRAVAAGKPADQPALSPHTATHARSSEARRCWTC